MKWTFRPAAENSLVESLAQSLGIRPLTATLLTNRNIDSYEKAKAYFVDSKTTLHDPFLMKDMEKAVNQLETAVTDHKPIMVYGDYDVDGVCSVALLTDFLRQHFKSEITPYIPNRHTEGYGISKQGIDLAHKKGIGLIIALDCGITATEQVEYAKSMGIDFIICDHHLPKEQLPNALAILNPKKEDCHYPSKELCGCAIGFKLLQGLCLKRQINLEQHLLGYLDLVAVATCSDIVPLTGENRALVNRGLNRLNTNPRLGLKTLMGSKDETRIFHVDDVVFKLGPKINSVGRMSNALEAVELLSTQDPKLSERLYLKIRGYNQARKDILEEVMTEAKNQMSLQEASNFSNVLFSPNWHKGVIGIVAARCIEESYKPTIILTESEGKVTGSARSIEGVNIHQALQECAEHLEKFGGHKQAAGMTIEKGKLSAFQKAFDQAIGKQINNGLLELPIHIDCEVRLDQLTQSFLNIIERMRPFGPWNPEPMFVCHNLVNHGASRLVGKEKKHLKLNVRELETSTVMDGIGFGLGQHWELIKSGKPFSLCFHLKRNSFRGHTALELEVKDIRPFSPKEKALIL